MWSGRTFEEADVLRAVLFVDCTYIWEVHVRVRGTSQRQRRDDTKGNGETNEHNMCHRTEACKIRRDLPDTRLIMGLLAIRRTVNAAISRTLDLELMVGLCGQALHALLSWYHWVSFHRH